MTAALCRAASVALAASSVAVWLLAMAELSDWGRFRPWWRDNVFRAMFAVLAGLAFPAWAIAWRLPRRPVPALVLDGVLAVWVWASVISLPAMFANLASPVKTVLTGYGAMLLIALPAVVGVALWNFPTPLSARWAKTAVLGACLLMTAWMGAALYRFGSGPDGLGFNYRWYTFGLQLLLARLVFSEESG